MSASTTMDSVIPAFPACGDLGVEAVTACETPQKIADVPQLKPKNKKVDRIFLESAEKRRSARVILR